MKNKIYELIGRAVVFTAGYAGAVAFCMWAFMQGTTY